MSDPTTSLDDESEIACPYCNEVQLLVVDPGTQGSFVQDCDVCCRPWQVYVSFDDDGQPRVYVERAQ